MSGPLVGAVLNDAQTRNPAVRFVLCVIAEQQRKPDQPIRLSLAYLSLMTGYSRRHVIDAVQLAEASGDLAVQRSEGRSNNYLVLPDDGQPVPSSAPVPVSHTSPGGEPHVPGPVSSGAPTPSVIARTRSGHASAYGARPPRGPFVEQAMKCLDCNRTYPADVIRDHQCTAATASWSTR